MNIEQIMNNTTNYEVLDKVKPLPFISNTDLMTIHQVASYYEVPVEAIRSVYGSNKLDFLSDDIYIMKCRDLICNSEYIAQPNGKYLVKLENGDSAIISKNQRYTCFQRKSILRFALLLKDSNVAKEIRNLLDVDVDVDHEEWNDLEVSGYQNFMNIQIPVVYGGFGKDQKCISDKTIAEIHGMEMFKVRERISTNIKRFKENVDFIDLKQRIRQTETLELLKELGYAQQSIVQTAHIYILSERGYAKLIKIMDTDKAWEIHDELMDQYFNMRNVIESTDQKKAMLLLSIYNGGQEGVLASKELVGIEVDAATLPLKEEIKQQQETIEQKEQENAVLQSDNDILAKEILTWTDRSKLNFGIRKLSKVTGICYGKLWNELYKQLKYKYSIDVKARAKKDYIKTIREDEWKRVTKSFAAICNSYNQSPTEMLDETKQNNK